MSRHTTTGCSRPWEVAKGYRYHTRQDLPLEPMAQDSRPLNYWIITAPALLVGLGLAILEIVR